MPDHDADFGSRPGRLALLRRPIPSSSARRWSRQTLWVLPIKSRARAGWRLVRGRYTRRSPSASPKQSPLRSDGGGAEGMVYASPLLHRGSSPALILYLLRAILSATCPALTFDEAELTTFGKTDACGRPCSSRQVSRAFVGFWLVPRFVGRPTAPGCLPGHRPLSRGRAHRRGFLSVRPEGRCPAWTVTRSASS